MEAVGFLQRLVRALGAGWAARYGTIAPYGVYGVTLMSDVGGAIEVVPSLVRGDAVVWSPFVFARGALHYDLHIDGELVRTPVLDEAVAHLVRWRRDRGPAGQLAARFGRAGTQPREARNTRKARTTEVDALAAADAVPESAADAPRGKRPGQTERARKLPRQRDRSPRRPPRR